MHTRLWRQRRRLILVFLLCACAGWIAFGDSSSSRLSAAFKWGILGLSLTAIAIIAWPDSRWFLFKASVLAPLLALLSLGAPIWIVLLIGAVMLTVLPSQPWALDRFRLRYVFKARKQVTIRLDADTLWQKVFPRETNEHWDPFLRGIRSGGTPDTYFLVYEALSQANDLQVPLRVFDVEPGVHFKSRDLSQPNASEGGPVIVTSYFIEASGEHSVLTLMEATWHPRLWTAFSQWLDDYLGDHADRVAALLEGRRDWSLKGASLKSLAEHARVPSFKIRRES